MPRRSTAGMGGGGSDSGASGNDGGGSGSGASGNDSGGTVGRGCGAPSSMAINRQAQLPDQERRRPLLSPRGHLALGEDGGDRDSIEEQAADDAGVLPIPSSGRSECRGRGLLQSQRPEDGEAWFAEAERKNGNVALIGASTWSVVALGWVHVDAAPLSGISGISGPGQAITYSLFEARSLLRNIVRTKAMGPNLGCSSRLSGSAGPR